MLKHVHLLIIRPENGHKAYLKVKFDKGYLVARAHQYTRFNALAFTHRAMVFDMAVRSKG